jgi:regulatory protein
MPAGTITALSMQTGDHERVNVFVDGAFAIGIDVATLQREGLFKGKVLSDEDWTRLARAESDQKAWHAALRLLEVRPRAEREIRDRLRRKEFDPDQIDSTVSRLRSLGLLDDAQFARLWVANRAATSPKGAQALRYELISKGVDRQIAGQIVEDALEGDTEAAMCEQVARKALPRYASSPDRATFQRRLGGLLQRRGFGWNIAGPVLERLWKERDEAGGLFEESVADDESE